MASQLHLCIGPISPRQLSSFTKAVRGIAQLYEGKWFLCRGQATDCELMLDKTEEILRSCGARVATVWTDSSHLVTVQGKTEFEKVLTAFGVKGSVVLMKLKENKLIRTVVCEEAEGELDVETVVREVKALTRTIIAGETDEEFAQRLKKQYCNTVEQIQRELEMLGDRLRGESVTGVSDLISAQESISGAMSINLSEDVCEVQLSVLEKDMREVQREIERLTRNCEFPMKVRELRDETGESYLGIFDKYGAGIASVDLHSDCGYQATVPLDSNGALVQLRTTLLSPGSRLWLSRSNRRISNEIVIE